MSKNQNSETTRANGLEEDIERRKRDGNLLYLRGKRYVLIRDYESAIESLSTAIGMLIVAYGAQANELAEPYFLYGKALLEIARSESNVLGEKIEVDTIDDSEDGEEDDGEEEGGGGDGGEEEGSEGGEGGDTEGDGGDAEGDGGDTEGDGGDTEGDTEICSSAEGEVDDFQLSWEYLELAKGIYSKMGDEAATKLAEVHLCLGENSLESGIFEAGIEDMKTCLSLQQQHCDETDRRIAETCYHIGTGYETWGDHDEARKYFERAKEQLGKKITALEAKLGSKESKATTGNEATEEKDAFYSVEGEIKEMKDLIVEIEEKIGETMNKFVEDNAALEKLKKQLIHQTKEGKTENGGGSSSSGVPKAPTGTSQSQSISNISHLVKRKRKSENESSGSGTPSEEKKAKQC